MNPVDTIKFSSSWGGKLFPQNFGTVRLFNTNKYYVGALHSVLMNGVDFGTAKIVALREFPFISIRDPLAYLDADMPATKLAAMIKTMYNDKVPGGIQPNTPLHHIVYRWHQRNYPVQVEYMQQYFQKILVDYQQALTN